MNAERLEETQRVVQEVARRWARGKPWAATRLLQDVLQEALLAAIAAEPSYRPELGTWSAYAAGAAHLAVSRYGWRFRGPVSPPRPERGGHPVDFESLDVLDVTLHAPSPEDQVARRQILARATKILRALDPVRGKPGYAVALGASPSEVARRRRRPVREVYYARKNLSRRAASHAGLRALLEELDR